MATNTTVTKRLIELNDEGIFVTADANENGKRLIEYIKRNRKTVKKESTVAKKDKEQLCL